MTRHDSDCSPVLLAKFRVAVCKFISVFYVAPKICFGDDGNAVAASKKIYMSTTCKKTQGDGTESDQFSLYIFDIYTHQT